MALLAPLPTIATLTTAVPGLSSTGVSSLATSALTQPVNQGDELVLVGAGETTSGIYAAAAAAVGATSITVVPFQPPTGGVPVGATVSDATSAAAQAASTELEASSDAVTAGVATVVPIGVAPANTTGEQFVGALTFVPSAAQAAEGGTNFATGTFRQFRAGALLNTLGSINFGTTALVADQTVSATITDPNPFQVQAGDVFDVQITHTGTGGAVPAGSWGVQEQ